MDGQDEFCEGWGFCVTKRRDPGVDRRGSGRIVRSTLEIRVMVQ